MDLDQLGDEKPPIEKPVENIPPQNNDSLTDEKSEEQMDEEPPEDFRTLDIAPTVHDLFDTNPFVRAAKIKENYDSEEHYLDVQFRLIREDFLLPLRRGVEDYLLHMGEKRYRNNDLRIYRNCQLETPEKGVEIKLNFGKLNFINWHQSKRLMHNGLLILSNDDFRSAIFVTVADRDTKELEKGIVSIELCDERVKIPKEMYNSNFVMLESKIFFEPYLAVLHALKQMDTEKFPMKNYLIETSIDIKRPAYLTLARELKYKNLTLPIRSTKPWPTTKVIGLDETQYDAYKHALTQELALIQGPPGTGKTYIALQIIRTLLENKEKWRRYGPIVIVCYTNHALDQFLEGILSYTKSIIRIGGQSKSPGLEPYTLIKKRRSHFRVSREKYQEANRRNRDAQLESADLEKEITRLRFQIKHLTAQNAIVSLEFLDRNKTDGELTDFNNNNEYLIYWLFEEDFQWVFWSLDLPPNLKTSDYICTSDQIRSDFDLFFPLEIINRKIAKLGGDKKLLNNSKASRYIKDNLLYQLQSKETGLNQQRVHLENLLKQHPLSQQRNLKKSKEQNGRWKTYWNCVKRTHSQAVNKLTSLETRYREVRAIVNDSRNVLDVGILEGHDIVGLTTTRAARLYKPLQELHAPIVLVEEAAEIFEAHVICSMTKSCQHLILIGDHKQLQPKASSYEIGKKYNLSISLFERMVNIRGGSCPQLGHQHRMRTEIAKLITPSIYKKLHNDKSVLQYPNVKGMAKNLFFLNHENRETSCDKESSWENKYEGEMSIALVEYFLKQGYEPTDITVLCTYTGQLFLLRKERDSRGNSLRGLHVTTVDNYQGEENKIIILSLVRNNGAGNIGFLREENRVCVALSRAREGLFIMGNMNDLVIKNQIWPKMKAVLEDQNAIENYLLLRCQVHTETLIHVKTINDFKQCPKGGCTKMCEASLSCGHICKDTCHVLDREHTIYRCTDPCKKTCSKENHPCKRACWEKCGPCRVVVARTLKCEHTVQIFCSNDPDKFPCYIKVNVVLPDCKHEVVKKCGDSIENTPCTHACEYRLPCGHICKRNCHVNNDPDHLKYKCLRECTKNYEGCEKEHECQRRCHEDCGLCPIIVEKHRSCGHHFKKVKCSYKIEENPCTKPCTKTLDCGHKCPMKCSETCGNCQEKVKKIGLTCKHEIQIKCCEEPTRLKCSGPCPELLRCGHPCTRRCKDDCTIKCEVLVKLDKPGLCGHIFAVPCYLRETDPSSPSLLQHCMEPCKVELECKHLCTGSCSQCLQGRIHAPCSSPCSNILICGHKCEIPCREECQPCKKPCELRCVHNRCGQKCGMTCFVCQEKCWQGCEHKKCSKRCGEPCNIEPCEKPCKKKLKKCKHPCVGFCGDPCPPLCRECDKEELTKIFFGTEDDDDARFVYLQDCKHCIESKALKTWMGSNNESVLMKSCPKCKTEIKDCPRVMNQIKKRLHDVLNVKRKIFHGNRNNLEKQQSSCLSSLNRMFRDEFISDLPEFRDLIKDMQSRGVFVSRKNRKQNLSGQEINAFEVQVQILIQIVAILSSIKKTKAETKVKRIVRLDRWRAFGRNAVDDTTFKMVIKIHDLVKDQVGILIEAIPRTWQMPKQTLDDIQLELQRLIYIVQLCNIDDSNRTEFKKVKELILSPKRFSTELESEVKSGMKELEKIINQKITIAERQMIVKAMNFQNPGHWYKCPNGHVYCIADCGGATMIGRCPECKERIGGTGHALLPSNTLASEMDGATGPAWPTGLMRY